ncbi:MAG TPA: hypothetical protein V6D03_11590 [Candidatus Caenarcaniphilales bacterium]
MNDPLRRLKLLPWRSLFQVSALATLIAVAIDFLLSLGYSQSAVVRSTIRLLYSSSLALLTTLAVGVAMGVLAVYLLERLSSQVLISNAILWALIPCLALTLVIKSLLPLPAIVVGWDETQLVGIVIGVFWKGRRYWR